MCRPAKLARAPQRLILAALCGFLLSGLPAAVHAQVIQATVGTSNLYDASGGSLELRGPDFTNRIDLGYAGHLRAGFSMARAYRGGILDLGDQTITFDLPTDIFEQSNYFLGRGVSYTRSTAGDKLMVFSGATANGFFAPFLNAASIDTASFALFYERKLTPHWKFYSRNAFSKRQTSIQSVEWSPKQETRFAMSGGTGNNEPYGAVSFTHKEKNFSLDASYAAVGPNFRRVLVQYPQISEPDRENISVNYEPWTNLRLTAARNNFASPALNGTTQRAAVNSAGAWSDLRGFQMYGSVNESSTSVFSGHSMSYLAGAQRNIMSRLDVGTNYTLSVYGRMPAVSSLTGTFRETISPRLSLTQLVTHQAGQTTVSYGGIFLSNRVTISADYETLFFPFALPGVPQFRQVMVLGLHFQLPHGMQINYGTDVSTNGQLHYSAYGTSIGFHSPRGTLGNGPQYAGAFFSNVARGRVVDPSGEPVSGAALQIGKQLAFTDSKGSFMIRLKNPGELPLEVDLDDFTAPGIYAVVSAPKTVQVTSEDASQEYKIVVKRVPAEAAQQPAPDPK